MNVIAIGKNSFLANQLKLTVGCKNWVFKTHLEIKSDASALLSADVVINLAVAPSIYTAYFSEDDNIDVWLAQQLQFCPSVHFVIVSTRQVYGDANHLIESIRPQPTSTYGQNKLNIESRVSELIEPSRLSILRCSNIFGFEIGRKTFFGSMLTSLISDDLITFNICPKTTKDFITVEDCAEVIAQVVRLKVAGVYNVGSGVDAECGALAFAVIKGFSKGRLISNNQAVIGQFSMDISKLKSLINYPKNTKRSLERAAQNLGLQLKDLAIKTGAF